MISAAAHFRLGGVGRWGLLPAATAGLMGTVAPALLRGRGAVESADSKAHQKVICSDRHGSAGQRSRRVGISIHESAASAPAGAPPSRFHQLKHMKISFLRHGSG